VTCAGAFHGSLKRLIRRARFRFEPEAGTPLKSAVRARSGHRTNVTRQSRTEPVAVLPDRVQGSSYAQSPSDTARRLSRNPLSPEIHVNRSAVHGQDALGFSDGLMIYAGVDGRPETASNATEERDREIPASHASLASPRRGRFAPERCRLGLVAAWCRAIRLRQAAWMSSTPHPATHVPLSLTGRTPCRFRANIGL
jgi:hypothetical protein